MGPRAAQRSPTSRLKRSRSSAAKRRPQRLRWPPLRHQGSRAQARSPGAGENGSPGGWNWLRRLPRASGGAAATMRKGRRPQERHRTHGLCGGKFTEDPVGRRSSTVRRERRRGPGTPRTRSHLWESNPRPLAYKARALPTELRWRLRPFGGSRISLARSALAGGGRDEGAVATRTTRHHQLRRATAGKVRFPGPRGGIRSGRLWRRDRRLGARGRFASTPPGAGWVLDLDGWTLEASVLGRREVARAGRLGDVGSREAGDARRPARPGVARCADEGGPGAPYPLSGRRRRVGGL